MKKNCRVNIADDFEYLSDSTFLMDNLNSKFVFENKDIHNIVNENKKEPIQIDSDVKLELDEYENINIDSTNIVQEDSSISIEDLEIPLFDFNKLDDDMCMLKNKSEESMTSDDSESQSLESVKINNNDIQIIHLDSDDSDDILSDDSSNNSKISNTDESSEAEDSDENEYDSEDECDDSDDSGDEDDESDDSDDDNDELDELYLIINKFPTQVAVIEIVIKHLIHLSKKKNYLMQN